MPSHSPVAERGGSETQERCLVDDALDAVGGIVGKGKESRGADAGADYCFGDFTRGAVATS